ncbi:hypothetical protein ACTI_74510 [Actinoplanes sp. OR16]|uniref:hypothetical protein n=1 Tax=Actinoplanes sp. OR16 TaxID=946334 RepID=UPI000F718321|nr:hypothetical protein [Actinoplanes sp. OR16]BBH70766.1 hypothetical protein ACTI_74510 [Actinoplanes sp. OR16]
MSEAAADNETIDRIVTIVLAEYAALRAEMLNKTTTRHTLLGFYVTALGVVLGFVLSGRSGDQLLLIIPILTCAFGISIEAEGRDKRHMGRYIDDVLRPTLAHQVDSTDVLIWESFYAKESRGQFTARAFAMFLLFPGTAIAALTAGLPNSGSSLSWTLWAIGVASQAALVVMSIPSVRRLVKVRYLDPGSGRSPADSR